MRIAIIGAGAIGSTIGSYLLYKGKQEVSLLARGAHLQAIQAKGLTLVTNGIQFESRPRASDNPADLGPQDVLIVTVKAHSLSALAPTLKPMLGPDTVVVAAQNGMPWWYFYGTEGAGPDSFFPTVDPDGVIWRSIGPERAIGCVINIPASIKAPGVASHVGRSRLHLGAPRSGDHQPILATLARAVADSGIETRLTDDIRTEVWSKLLLNCAFCAVSVLTGATSGGMRKGPRMRETFLNIMHEAVDVASAWGVTIPYDLATELDAAGSNPSHKTSMLQDYEAGRPLELDAILGAVIELGRRRQVKVPIISTLWSLTQTKLLAERG
jgi:2-dehydropantoate 2-reductase